MLPFGDAFHVELYTHVVVFMHEEVTTVTNHKLATMRNSHAKIYCIVREKIHLPNKFLCNIISSDHDQTQTEARNFISTKLNNSIEWYNTK